MTEQDKPAKLDQLLDSLLAGYSDAEPRPGLETRLLAHLRAHSLANPRPWFMRFLWAGAACSALLVAMFAIYWSRLPELPQPPRAQVASPPHLPPAPLHPVGPRKQRPRAQQSPGILAEIRRQVFPTPAPLSEQEQLLLRYLAHTPKEEVAAQSRGDEQEQAAEPSDPQVQQINATETHSTR